MTEQDKLLIALRGWHTLKGADCFREAADEIQRLREDLQRTESARVALLAENEHYKRRVEELSIHAEKWVQRALTPAHEREAPHCSSCSCGMDDTPKLVSTVEMLREVEEVLIDLGWHKDRGVLKRVTDCLDGIGRTPPPRAE